MKPLILLILMTLTLLLSSCTGHDFKVGECLQKPDEASIWKIDSFNEGSAVLVQQTKVSNVEKKEVNLPAGYITTNCR